MKKKVFEGCATALVTPFTEDGVDFDAFEAIIEEQIERGVASVVVAGTTGEAPTLSDAEREEMIRTAIFVSRGRVKVIAGCGSNSSTEARRRCERALRIGADAALVVTPYYNKASSAGLVEHYRAVASVGIPVIIYNVPSRTGVDIGIRELDELVPLEGVVGIKEASGSVSRAACLISRYKDELPLYSGSDEVNLPILSIGGAGVVSVLSNVFPREVAEICRLGERSREIAERLFPFCAALFSEVNPIPVKTVMAHTGRCREIFRLPMCAMDKVKREKLIEEYEKIKGTV